MGKRKGNKKRCKTINVKKRGRKWYNRDTSLAEAVNKACASNEILRSFVRIHKML